MSALLLALGCAGSLPAQQVAHPEPAAVDLDAPGPIRHEAVVSARWAVPLSGLLDLDDPKAAELQDGPYDIVLPVHVLTHPDHGVFVIDSGVSREANNPMRGVLAMYAGDIEVVEPLADIVARQEAPLAAVLLTHAHLDHVLGLPDVPDVPVYAGPGEHEAHGFQGRIVLPTVRRALGDRPMTLWDFEGAEALGPIDHAVDVLGDGSLWALSVPGHTAGSTAYLARTEDGPVLFTGDCSHTRWGWEHGVAPGTFTEDPEGNRRSLAALRELAAAHPGLRVEVGHEL